MQWFDCGFLWRCSFIIFSIVFSLNHDSSLEKWKTFVLSLIIKAVALICSSWFMWFNSYFNICQPQSQDLSERLLNNSETNSIFQYFTVFLLKNSFLFILIVFLLNSNLSLEEWGNFLWSLMIKSLKLLYLLLFMWFTSYLNIY